MAREMFDCAFPPAEQPALPAGRWAAGGYLDVGAVSHAWSAEEWARVRAWPDVSWVVPISVIDPNDDGHALAVESVRQAEALGCPRGVCLALDIEANVAEAVARSGNAARWCDYVRGSGFVPLVYTSEATWHFLTPTLHGARWWLADWNGDPASDIPGASAVQYAAPGHGTDLPVDLSTITDDALPLWPMPAPAPVPQPVHLNKPVCTIVGHPGGGGYWIVARDGGVFAFGTAEPFPHNTLPGHPLLGEVVGAAVNGSGKGLWLVTDEGAVYTLGDAVYQGGIPDIGH